MPRPPRAARRRTAWRRAVSRWTPIPDRRLAQRQGAGADRRQRPRQRRHRADRREGHPELGDLQRRPQYTVQFRQDPNWAVLNRVNDPKARPSQIQGQIKADGTVMIVNRNGVVFDGSAQVNAAQPGGRGPRLSDEQFQNNGLYSADGKTPNFTDALGKIEAASGRGHRDQPSVDRDPVRRLSCCWAAGRQCRHHHHAQGSGGAGGRRQFRDQAARAPRATSPLPHAAMT